MIFKEEVFAIIGAAMEVQRTLGAGFLEAIYQEALALELDDRGIPFRIQVPLKVTYKNKVLTKAYIADAICHDNIILELKALDELSDKYVSQVINYLKATQLKLGLLINFGSCNGLQWQRIVL